MPPKPAGRVSVPLKWHGGKSMLAPWILEHAPDEFVHYAEPYFGGGSVLLAQEGGVHSEAVNDLNETLMNFWNVLGCPVMFPLFEQYCQGTPFSEPHYDSAQIILGMSEEQVNALSPHDNPIETAQATAIYRAWAFFIANRFSRQGLMKNFATLTRNRTRRGMNEQASSWLTAVDNLPEFRDRLRGVVIQNKKAVDFINDNDSPNTWFYLDPPYLHESRVTTDDYEFEMSYEDHEDLLNALEGIEGKFCLSGYPSRLYDARWSHNGWNRVEKTLACHASGSKTKKPDRTEVLWMNY